MELPLKTRGNLRRKTKLWLAFDNESAQLQVQKNKQKQFFFNDLLNTVNKDFPKQHRHFLIKFILSNNSNSRKNIFSLFSRFKNLNISSQNDSSPLNVNPFIFTDQNHNHLKINIQKTKESKQYTRYSTSQSNRNRKIGTPINRQTKIIFNKKKVLDLDRKMQAKYVNNIADKLFLKSPIYYQKPKKLKRKAQLSKIPNYRDVKRRFKTDADEPSSEVPSNYIYQLLKAKNADFYFSSRPLESQNSFRNRL